MTHAEDAECAEVLAIPSRSLLFGRISFWRAKRASPFFPPRPPRPPRDSKFRARSGESFLGVLCDLRGEFTTKNTKCTKRQFLRELPPDSHLNHNKGSEP